VSEVPAAPRPSTGVSDESAGEYRWLPNPGLAFGLLASILIAGAGLLFSRPQLVLIAAPILVSVVWALARRPRTDAKVGVRTTVGARAQADFVEYRVAFDVPAETDAVVVRLYERGRDRSELVVDAATAQDLAGQVAIVHSGPQEILRVDYLLVGPYASATIAPARGPRSSRVIPPRIISLRRLPLPFRMFGLSGGHDSARPGDGGEFRDIHQFAPGDRLRRIDWRVTARHANTPGDLYVRRSFSTADATVLVVMDSRDDVAELITNRTAGGLKSDGPTSLDVAREAASSIASGYISSGDRVGFRDLAGSTRMIPPGGGSAQRHRVLSAIARTRPIGAPQRRLRAPVIPAGTIVYVLSTFLDNEAGRMAELWRVAGHRVVLVDTLLPTTMNGLRREQQTALRIIQLEREARILALGSLGVDVIRWHSAGDPSPEVQLSTRTRTSRKAR
jgi:uncharacterized protein (DUF58 family)